MQTALDTREYANDSKRPLTSYVRLEGNEHAVRNHGTLKETTIVSNSVA